MHKCEKEKVKSNNSYANLYVNQCREITNIRDTKVLKYIASKCTKKHVFNHNFNIVFTNISIQVNEFCVPILKIL